MREADLIGIHKGQQLTVAFGRCGSQQAVFKNYGIYHGRNALVVYKFRKAGVIFSSIGHILPSQVIALGWHKNRKAAERVARKQARERKLR